MIATALPMHPDGFAFDLFCPVVVCDHCRLPIDAENPGNVLWEPGRNGPMRHTHKGACDFAFDPHHLLASEELDQWLERLAHNYAHPLIGATIKDYNGRSFRVSEVEVRS